LAIAIVLGLLAFVGVLCWFFLKAWRGKPRDQRETLEEYLRSRPYDPVQPRPHPSGPAPSTSVPRPEPRPRTTEDVPPQRSVRPPDVDELVAHLRALDWFQFENAIGVLYGHIGHRVRRTGGANPDGGIDLELTRGTDRIAVQCKHWQAGEVGVKVVREFMGAMVAAGITQGILIGSAGFTGPARELAVQQRIELLDERDVARRIQSAGGWWDPLFRSAFVSPPKLCPKCGSPLVERVAKRGPGIGKAFYGCSRYPRCTQTMPG
jgi:restriction system protein